VTWTVARRLDAYDFDVVKDPIGGFATKRDACDQVVEMLERERRDLNRAIRKAKRMRRRAAGAQAERTL
jgi:hypothetical protein